MARLSHGFRINPWPIAIVANPSLQCSFLFRLCRHGGPLSRLARQILLCAFSSDVSPGQQFKGAVNLPHPVGIVVGHGARLNGDVTIYQNVTIGGSRSGGYPTVGNAVTIYPNSVITGDVHLGDECVIGALSFVNQDIQSRATYRRSLG
ncbi:hypothetical protein ACI78R_18150 [Geodermatophilus sp. SYSU D01106]